MHKDENGELNSEEVIDVEASAKAGKPVPPGSKYRIRVDKDNFTVDRSTMTGAEILGLVKKTPATHNLYQHVHGGQTKLIGAGESVDFTEPGVERFTTMKIANQEGEERAARRSFALQPADVEFLDRTFRLWEAVVDGKKQWVIAEGFKLPAGYNVAEASIALRIAPTYPDVQIDMAYFSPALTRADGRPMNNLTQLKIDGKEWQQWSRHRAAGDWRPDVDNIETHLLYVTAFLDGELKK